MVRGAVRKLKTAGHRLCATSQNFTEFWNVATRPAMANGYGYSPAAAHKLLRLAERIFFLLPDSPLVYDEWRRLVVVYSVSGVQVHVARLVAAMLVNGVTHILTLNTNDFARYVPEGVKAIDPATV
jgi:hypothetical protein